MSLFSYITFFLLKDSSDEDSDDEPGEGQNEDQEEMEGVEGAMANNNDRQKLVRKRKIFSKRENSAHSREQLIVNFDRSLPSAHSVC